MAPGGAEEEILHFGASTFIWASPFGTDTLDLIDKVKSLGFDFIEICVERPETIDTDLILARLRETDLKALVCGAFGTDRDMSAEAAATRENAALYLRKCIDIAHELGSPTVSGPMYAGVGNTAMRTPEERRAQWERSAATLRPIADYAASRDVKLALEPLNRFETDLINTVEQGLRFLDDVGRENVGLLLDTFHMNIEEKDIRTAIRSAGLRIFEFHACANDRGTPGEDHLPWEDIRAALASVAYDGPIVIEAFTPKIKEIARAVSLWRPLAESEDALAINGLAHLRRVFG
jgi:D-psicose/D-tagatose/L-ribulose 3-epimerase